MMANDMPLQDPGTSAPISARRCRSEGKFAYLPAVVMLIASVVVLGGLSLRPPAGQQQVAAVFAPTEGFSSIQDRLAGSGMRLVRNGLFGNIVIVDLGDGSSSQLLEAGAWFVADPQMLGGCFAPPATNRSAQLARRADL